MSITPFYGGWVIRNEAQELIGWAQSDWRGLLREFGWGEDAIQGVAFMAGHFV